MTGYVIFSFDKNSDIHAGAKFYRFIDTLRAMGKLRGNVVKCFGMYAGVIEDSFIARRDDFFEHIFHSGFVSGQESFLMVPDDVKQPASLYYQTTGKYDTLGKLVVSEDMPNTIGWTYRPDLEQYWTVGE